MTDPRPSPTGAADAANVTLRGRRPRDLPTLRRWFTDPAAQWREWDAPYLNAADTTASLGAYVHRLETTPTTPNERVVDLGGTCIGMLNRAEDASDVWDLGVIIFDPLHWGRGIGRRALALWIEATLNETDAHVLTFSTWSGNERMIRAAHRLGFREAGRVREARLVRGQRHDSVTLDLLRREWTPRP